MRRSVFTARHRATTATTVGWLVSGASVVGLIPTTATLAGPYAPAAGVAGSTAISKDSSAIKAWATGYQDYDVGAGVDAQWKDASQALGPAEGDIFSIVSLGNGGAITLTFDKPIGDGPGFDFAIFENGITATFLELAWVEVSDGGTNFVRFANDSLTASAVPFFGGSVDPTDIDGLAGKYAVGQGTPFDLHAAGLSRATHVRIVDIVGDGTARDSSGDRIYDPTPTVGSGGFDLDAAASLYEYNGLAGDIDFDGIVNLDDLAILAGAFGRIGDATWSNGSFDFDLDVDWTDLQLLAGNYAAGEQQAYADFQSLTGIPEPGAALTLGVIAAASLARRRRRHA